MLSLIPEVTFWKLTSNINKAQERLYVNMEIVLVYAKEYTIYDNTGQDFISFILLKWWFGNILSTSQVIGTEGEICRLINEYAYGGQKIDNE